MQIIFPPVVHFRCMTIQHTPLNSWIRWWFATISLLVPGFHAAGQLVPGDIAVVSINTNNRLCSATASAEDILSFICFKDIPPGTKLDLTDNGWERLIPGKWGNSEGILTAARTGTTIPAGTVITFVFPPVGNQPYAALAPDNNWVFSQQSLNGVNLNSGGDQLFFLQGGTWQNPGTNSNFSHNASYQGGSVLLAFNTKAAWNAFTDNSQESGIHPDLPTCLHWANTGSSSDFIRYTGPMNSTTPFEWRRRFQQASNWKSYSSCTEMPPLPSTFQIAPSEFRLTCTTCNACSPFEEKLRVSLPSSGEPFQIKYTDGRDTFTKPNLKNGDTILYRVNQTSSLQLLQVWSADSCPVFFPQSQPTSLSLSNLTAPSSLPTPTLCGNEAGVAVFNLSTYDSLFTKKQPGFLVHWFRDSVLKNPISQPAQFSSPPTTVFALVSDGICTLGPFAIPLRVSAVPKVTLPLGGRLCTEAVSCLDMPFQFKGTPPFVLQYELELPGQSPTPQSRKFPQENMNWTICPDTMGVRSGDMIFHYKTITDGNGCSLNVDKQISVVRRGRDGIHRITPTLCPGQTFKFMDRTYDALHPSDTIIIPEATSTGCDSLIIIQLNYTDTLSASLSGDLSVCAGSPLKLTWNLKGGTRFNITYQVGETSETVANKQINGVQHGDLFELWFTQSEYLRILNVQAQESGCSIRPGLALPVQVNDLRVSAQQIPRFGNVSVSCHGGSDGSAQAYISGGVKPYSISWNSGDTSLHIKNLVAGTYEVAILDQKGCKASTSTEVKEPKPAQITLETEAPACNTVTGRAIIQRISGGTPPFSYTIGSKPPTSILLFPTAIPSLTPGSYVLQLTDANLCTFQTAFEMPASRILEVDLGADRVIQSGDTVLLTAKPNFSPATIRWSPEEANQQVIGLQLLAQPLRTTTYRVEVADEHGCTTRDDVTIRVQRGQHIFAPTAFSPNGDGTNDVFVIFTGPDVAETLSLRIFNRWGTQVFESDHALSGNTSPAAWDGNIQGKPAPTGTYLFLAAFKLKNGEVITLNGDFVLMR